MKNTAIRQNVKCFFTLVFTLILLILSTSAVYGAETVTVRLSPHNVEIDYMSVYSPSVEYPVLTYKGITYIPLTYSLCERLGLAVGFTERDGLYIARYDDAIFGQAPEDKPFGGEGNWIFGDYTAYIPEYPVYINGVYYSSHKEEYPCFNFGGITYLPLTYELAYCELGITVELTDGNLYIRRMENKPSYAGRLHTRSGDNLITNHRIEVKKYTDGDGAERFFNYSWWDVYTLGYNRDLDFLTYNGSYESLKHLSGKIYYETSSGTASENVYTLSEDNGDKGLYYKGEKIDTLQGSTDYFAREYVFDDVTFICVNVYTNNAPAPYTSHEEYLYARDENGTKRLAWDTRNNLIRILPDGIGGYYLCSDAYSPLYSARWSTSLASVCHYKANGGFSEVVIPDTNSITGYDFFGGRLYVRAMLYYGDKNVSGVMPIDPVTCGYYIVDPKDDSAVKLYPYISGEVFVSDKGGFYCVYNSGARPKIVNFVTKRITEIR